MNTPKELYILNLNLINRDGSKDSDGKIRLDYVKINDFLQSFRRFDIPVIVFGGDPVKIFARLGRSIVIKDKEIHPIKLFAYIWSGCFKSLIQFCFKIFTDHEIVVVTDDPSFATECAGTEGITRSILISGLVDTCKILDVRQLEGVGVELVMKLNEQIFLRQERVA